MSIKKGILPIITILNSIPPQKAPYFRSRLDTLKRLLLTHQSGYSSELNNVRGPSTRRHVLIKSLKSVGQTFLINPELDKITPFVHVLSNIHALEWAINQKNEGKILKLIAGPNIVSFPSEYNHIITNKSIDLVLTGSSWVNRMFLSYCPELKNRTAVIIGGVDEMQWKPDIALSKDIDFLIYDKTDPSIWRGDIEQEHTNIKEQVKDFLLRSNYSSATIKYGCYTPDEYSHYLFRSKAMIYLSRQETFGNALLEAWSCDVPTLVWDRKHWTCCDNSFHGASSAPYLSIETGLSFKNFTIFETVLNKFIIMQRNLSFQPRRRILAQFSLRSTGREYINLWKKALEDV